MQASLGYFHPWLLLCADWVEINICVCNCVSQPWVLFALSDLCVSNQVSWNVTYPRVPLSKQNKTFSYKHHTKVQAGWNVPIEEPIECSSVNWFRSNVSQGQVRANAQTQTANGHHSVTQRLNSLCSVIPLMKTHVSPVEKQLYETLLLSCNAQLAALWLLSFVSSQMYGGPNADCSF